MSRNRKSVRTIRKYYRKICKSATKLKKLLLWLLQNFLVAKRKPRSANAGFVLPTVAMVSLVVVLLTTAMLFRSFERSKNASNVRVNEAVLNASMPAIDRAKAKIEQLLSDPSLPRATPSDSSLYNALTKKDNTNNTKRVDKYTFGDETQLLVQYDVDEDGTIDEPTDQTDLENREKLDTAWRYPVDTDNDGQFDSFTIYGIYFRSPSRNDSTGKFDRSRNPLDARTPPMDDGTLGGLCAAARGTSASLIGESGWYKAGSNIKKSFFVYTLTVPITEEQIQSENLPKTGAKSYEAYTGNKAFSALEFQQDQERTPLVSNAVVYEDDLDITPGTGLRINGSIFTNSNLFASRPDRLVKFYQVSSPKSCFYQAQNSKIVVGGNVGHGRVTGAATTGSVEVDLFKPGATANDAIPVKSIDSDNKSASNSSTDIAYNTRAFDQRINRLVNVQMGNNPNQDPSEVKENIAARLGENKGLDPAEVRREELESYFKKRTIKVPFARVAMGVDGSTDFTALQGSADTLRGQNEWIYPAPANTGLRLLANKLPATEPNKLKAENKEREDYVGDRVLVGNNLPALWFDTSSNSFVGKKTPQKIDPETPWDSWTEEKYKFRTRTTKIEQLISLSGATDRDGFFELKATEKPKNPLDNVGGMRVITGAGIYVDGPRSDVDASYPWDSPSDLDRSTPGDQKGSFLRDARPSLDANFVGNAANRIKPASLQFKGKDPIVVWSDAMPMSPTVNQNLPAGLSPDDKGDLLMRATAVYHYKEEDGINQKPIACVSSYYDPTNSTTARNALGLPGVGAYPVGFPYVAAAGGKSNNGVVYPSYTGSRAGAISTYSKQLRQQARLVFPDGRFVNEPLRNALLQFDANKPLSMADNSAIDTAVCAIQILDRTLTPNDSKIPHGAIYETAFLDAREVKSIEREANVADVTGIPLYTRSLEERQPLEVRATVLDMNQLRLKKIGSSSPSQEYLLPNSGIIYATRDDALPDLSETPDSKIADRNLLSPSDYKLDSTRRPNGIMLINGPLLHRELQFREEEKGLILATNVPAYVRGNFNLHAKGGTITQPVEEFTRRLRDSRTNEINWDDFYRRDLPLDDNFACRKGDPRLPNDKCQIGDSWRPATVLADAVTVLSDNFRFGFRDEGDYDLRNNSGTATITFTNGYDFNSDGKIDAADTADETKLQVDLNNDGDTIDANEILFADLNGDGDANDTAVAGSSPLRVNAIRAMLGFFDNSFVTSASWFNINAPQQGFPKDFDTSLAAPNYQGSSYVNNFITPIQRRVQFGEYVMEICKKVPVTNCTPGDWVVSFAKNAGEKDKKASEIPVGTLVSTLDSGTTSSLPAATDQRFPRRVAFLRDPENNRLILDDKGAPVPIGVDKDGKLQYYPYNSLKIPVNNTDDKLFKTPATGAAAPSTHTFAAYNPDNADNRPRYQSNGLWFRTAKRSVAFNNNPPASAEINYGKKFPLFYSKKLDASKVPGSSDYQLGTIEQPLLVPVLQIHMPYDEWTSSAGDPGEDRPGLPGLDNNNRRGIAAQQEVNWMQTAVPTTTNLVIAAGDTPSRPTEYNGGLGNFIRQLERWRQFGGGAEINYSLSGSIIQYKRSAYATGPWDTIQTNAGGTPSNTSLFGYDGFYRTDVNTVANQQGKTPFYAAPSRQWGFDVAFLSQIPDLFAQQFTLPPSTRPNEFFREVSRDDEWVKTLLCARIANNPNQKAIPDKERPKDFCTKKTGS